MARNYKKKNSRIFGWIKRLFFGPQKELSMMEEEQIQSPGRTIVKNFTSNKLAMFGTIVFLAVFIFVMIGQYIWPIDLSYEDNTQKNVAPGYDMMSVSSELKGKVKEICAGKTFGVGLSTEGKVYIWGKTRITTLIDLADIPDEVKNAFIVDIAVGDDHIVAMDDTGAVYVWGMTRNDQANIPSEVKGLTNVKQIDAGNQFSAVLTEDGDLYLWGNGNQCDIDVKHSVQGKIAKVALSSYSYVVLLNDGSVQYAGYSANAISTVPEQLTKRDAVIDIAAASDNIAAVCKDGSVVVWGNASHGEKEVPDFGGGKVLSIAGGRYHYTAHLDNGNVACWGDDLFDQTEVPASLQGKEITTIYSGFYQNYAVLANGETTTWGLRGYLLGTDHLGRDIFTRIVNGGQVTMTVGTIAVVIQIFLGVVLGGLAGYFGGKIDMIIMRVAEVIGSLPFLPFALILSSILGQSVSVEQKMYMIMVVLGILGWVGIARLVRAQMFAQREMEFVTAAKAMGVKESKIVFKHILPNVLSTILVSATLSLSTAMLTESSLSYLGFGIAPPTPTWGNMLTGANDSIVIQQYWWRWVFPSLIFGICTICINLMGDGLRDAVDPKSAER